MHLGSIYFYYHDECAEACAVSEIFVATPVTVQCSLGARTWRCYSVSAPRALQVLFVCAYLLQKTLLIVVKSDIYQELVFSYYYLKIYLLQYILKFLNYSKLYAFKITLIIYLIARYVNFFIQFFNRINFMLFKYIQTLAKIQLFMKSNFESVLNLYRYIYYMLIQNNYLLMLLFLCR